LTSSSIEASFSTSIAFSARTFFVSGSSSYISGYYIFSSSLASAVAVMSGIGSSAAGGCSSSAIGSVDSIGSSFYYSSSGPAGPTDCSFSGLFKNFWKNKDKKRLITYRI
jgi:hypothetical protein